MTSVSSASLQIGRCCERQKARVHWVQEADAARSWSCGDAGCSGLPKDESPCGPSCIKVLFLKQVHLQNVGAAAVKTYKSAWLIG